MFSDDLLTSWRRKGKMEQLVNVIQGGIPAQ